MERYDGKTKRDDYIKYGLITLGVLVVLGLLIWFTGFMKARRQSNPDFTVVVASEEHNDGCDISSAPFWSQLGLEDIPFYACVLDNGNGEEMSFAEQVIFALKNANVTLW